MSRFVTVDGRHYIKCIRVFEPTKLKFYFKLHFSAAKKVRETRVSQQHKGKSDRPEDNATHGRLPIKMFPKVTWSLLRNAPFVLVMITGGTEGILTSGFATFAPKYIQNKFHVSSGTAALLTGEYGRKNCSSFYCCPVHSSCLGLRYKAQGTEDSFSLHVRVVTPKRLSEKNTWVPCCGRGWTRKWRH